jgi:hypothetical protein
MPDGEFNLLGALIPLALYAVIGLAMYGAF